jgi:hypothetical protein
VASPTDQLRLADPRPPLDPQQPAVPSSRCGDTGLDKRQLSVSLEQLLILAGNSHPSILSERHR